MADQETRVGEVWKAIPGWPYEASSYGRIRRSGKATRGTTVGRILKPTLGPNGYLHVDLWDKKPATKAVHRLVTESFYGPCPKGKECNHKDGNKQNNSTANLEYVTPSWRFRERKRDEG